jgi:hypothetical protein
VGGFLETMLVQLLRLGQDLPAVEATNLMHAGTRASVVCPHTRGSCAYLPCFHYYSLQESRTKCIGLTIETRPDYCLTPHLTDMLSYGCTRLEMGVQVGPDLLCSASDHHFSEHRGGSLSVPIGSRLMLLSSAGRKFDAHIAGYSRCS